MILLSLLTACTPHQFTTVNTSASCGNDTGVFTNPSAMVVGGVTAYDGLPLSNVTVGLLDGLPNDTWGTDDPMVVVDEMTSDTSGNYAVSAHEHSSYWLLGTYEDRYGKLASVTRLDLTTDGQTEFTWIDLASIGYYDSETADEAGSSCLYNWEQLSYSCSTTDMGTECAWQWGNC